MDRPKFLKDIQYRRNEMNMGEGSDQLEERYNNIIKLEKNIGKENVHSQLVGSLKETIMKFKDDEKYNEDKRFVHLVLIYVNMKCNKLAAYMKFFRKGMCTKSALLYDAWSKEFLKQSQLLNSQDVINKGYEMKAEPKNVLDESLRYLNEQAGKVMLSGKWDCRSQQIHCLCKIYSPHFAKSMNDKSVKNSEMNPLTQGAKDSFTCPVMIPDLVSEEQAIRCYPKERVYVGEKEYQLEEVLAEIYFEKSRLAEEKKKKIPLEPASTEKENNMIICEESTQHQSSLIECHQTTPPHHSLMGNEVSVNNPSVTFNTKAVLNEMDRMWTSPTPTLKKRHSEMKAPQTVVKVRESDVVSTPANSQVPFTIFKDSSILLPPSNVVPLATSSETKPTGLSERKIAVLKPVSENEPHVSAKQQLFSVPALEKPSITDDQLAFCMDTNTQVVHPLSAAAAANWDEDLTVNTKVFNHFFVQASTPIDKGQDKKSYNKTVTCVAKKENELSDIMEQSKERSVIENVQYQQPTLRQQLPIVKEIEQLQIDDNLQNFEETDPFDREVQEMFLSKLNFPECLPSAESSVVYINSNIPVMKKTCKIGEKSFALTGEFYKGAYAKIVKANHNGESKALKVEKPACLWEFYICKEIRKHLSPENLNYFINMDCAYIFVNGSILELPWAPYGTLLDILNAYNKNQRGMGSDLALIFAIDLLRIINTLHSDCQIIHGDIKPDNFVVTRMPTIFENSGFLQLIDFGRSIDMKLYPKGTQFTKVVTTDCFQCNEMKEKLPWSYQTDLFGLAGTIYCLIVGDYMKTIKKGNLWTLQKPLPRSAPKSTWDPLFSKLLNIPSSNNLPDLQALITHLQRNVCNRIVMKKCFVSLSDAFKTLADSNK